MRAPIPSHPYPGTIWRHRKHNPPDHWHEYQVLGVNLAGPCGEGAHQNFTAQDSTTLELWDVAVAPSGCWLYQQKDGLPIWRDEPTVCYTSTKDNLARPWVRPLSEFLDGRFEEVKN